VKVSWEGPDGQFSYRRASQFVIICLIVFLVVSNRVQNQYSFYTLVALLATFLLLAKIITPKEILEFKEQAK
jgi:4-hydroxybenzoate polyprenyltransferase